MGKIKIAFFDIDGTLIDMGKKRVTPGTLDMLNRLRKNGIRICLATGRTPVTLPRFEGVTFDACITFNGSYCFCPEGDIFSNPIRPEDVQTIIRNASALRRPVSVATRDRLAANGSDADLAAYYAIAGLGVDVADDFDQVARGEVYQIMLGCRREEYAPLLRDVQHARIAAWWDRAVDVIPASGGKGVGVGQVLRHFQLDREEAIAFGDGDNDLELLAAVGTGVAMGNASAKLKALADDVCASAADDGVARYCAGHGLI